MARRKCASRRRRRSAARRRLQHRLRNSNAAAIALNIRTDIVSVDPDSMAASLPTGDASEGIAEVIDEKRLPHPVNGVPRLIRIRICGRRKVLYSAEDPTGIEAAKNFRAPIRFGGVFTDYNSNIVLSSSEDLVYFDKIPALALLGILGATSTSASTPSDVERIALNISRLPSTGSRLLACTIDNDALAGLYLVITDDDVGDLVKDIEPNQWGFKEVPEDGLRERQPALYDKGLRVVESFNSMLEDGEMQYVFVFDWGLYGK
ncbi:hypothetical protein F5Y10DRAFT_186520 [Nemania abortiva]|nr:hypothetical protein F5Y10DRAFT_186520 [Nemania abortiva]